MSIRKTVSVRKMVLEANVYLASDRLSCEEKRGVIFMLEKILFDSNQYNGFMYLDTYNANDPEFSINGRKDLRRQYAMKK